MSAEVKKAETELPDVLTVEELAKLLRLNVKTVYDAIAQGKIPGCRRVGRIIRVSRQAVLSWLAG